MSSDILLKSEQLTFRAIPTSNGHLPAKRFVDDLDDVARRDLMVAARILATTCAVGRSPGNRVQRVAGSRQKLYELRITPPGRGGAHHRLLYVRERNTIFVARGLTTR